MHLSSCKVLYPRVSLIYVLTLLSSLEISFSRTHSGHSKLLFHAQEILLNVSECFPQLHLNHTFCPDFGLYSYGLLLFLSDHSGNTSGYK